MNRHIPVILVAIGLVLVVWRPEWVSVAVLALLVIVALVVLSEQVAEGEAVARLGARLLELETRLAAITESDARNDAHTAKRLAEAEQRIQQAHERLQGMAPPRRGAGL